MLMFRRKYTRHVNTFRKEAHAEKMRDYRHVTTDGYMEGDTEDLLMYAAEALEDFVIRQLEIQDLEDAMQSLTRIQRERLHLYFYEDLTYREIGERLGISDSSVRESIDAALKKMKKILN